MEFRARDYRAEESAASLLRSPAHDHPLALPSPSPTQVSVINCEKVEFDHPLRAHTENIAQSDGWSSNSTLRRRNSDEASCFSTKEWTVFCSSLGQKFSYNNKILISPTLDINVSSSKGYGKSLADVHVEELDDPEMVFKEEKRVLTRQEYASRLQELKSEISQSWRADDRVKALKLSIKVARLLMDTAVTQFYPTLFTLVIEVLDMLGDLVWERIMTKAEYSEDGRLIRSLPESFESGDICFEAKETCYNWFCKIGSIRELLPRIYLQLAILRCRRFLEDDHLYNLHCLTMMMRGIADPLASAYCHLYMAHCATSLNPGDIGYLITSISDLTILLERMIVSKDAISHHSYKSKKMLIALMEPAIEWILKCIFVYRDNKGLDDVLAEFGFFPLSKSTRKIPGVAIVLHHLLKQLPPKFVSMNAPEIIELIGHCNDMSFEQHLNYRLVGLKLCQSSSPFSSIEAVLSQITKVVNQCNHLDEYLMITDAYVDIILHYVMDDYLPTILDGILRRAQSSKIGDNEVDILQSILVKLVDHFDRLECVFSLDCFMGILELLHGSSRNTVDLEILLKATRTGFNSDPTTVQFLFEISQALHDSIDITDVDRDQQEAHLISSFVRMVDFGVERERHLTFLIECRSAFGQTDGLDDTLVHLSNNLAVKAVKTSKKSINFLKACMAFNEVTIPSISSNVRRMNLCIETAEVALLGGLISHARGFINSATSCVRNLNVTAGLQQSIDIDEVVSLSCKLCSVLVMVPDFHNEGFASLPENLISAVESLSSPWIKMKICCSVISLAASLSQNKLPYHASSSEVVSNDQLFYGDACYHEKLLSLGSMAVHRLINIIEEESYLVTKGKLAVEACNCLIGSFKPSLRLQRMCVELIGIAKSCLHGNDGYLEATTRLLDKLSSNL